MGGKKYLQKISLQIMPEVSVIVPNYNHAPFLQERIDSILQQTYRDFEVIILDDASTDNSRSIIETYRNCSQVTNILYNDRNSGSPYLQWQKGIESAKGNWIWVAESDDYAYPYFLEKMIALINNGKEISLAFSDSQIEEKGVLTPATYSTIRNQIFKTDKWSHAYTEKGIDEINESLKWECTVNNASAALFKAQMAKSCVSNLSLFRYHGDWMFYILMAGMGNIAYSPENLNIFREHGKNLSHDQLPEQSSKLEKFRILQHLLSINGITEPGKVVRYFLQHHIGYGILTGPAFGKNGYFNAYSRINNGLSRRILLGLLTERFKIKISR